MGAFVASASLTAVVLNRLDQLGHGFPNRFHLAEVCEGQLPNLASSSVTGFGRLFPTRPRPEAPLSRERERPRRTLVGRRGALAPSLRSGQARRDARFADPQGEGVEALGS
jgi:hypothetical protein